MKPLPRFRRVGLLPALVAILIASGPAVSAASPVTRPNIVFILVDEMRWDALTCAGHPFVRTPHLDTLAREGTRFHHRLHLRAGVRAVALQPFQRPLCTCAWFARQRHARGSRRGAPP